MKNPKLNPQLTLEIIIFSWNGICTGILYFYPDFTNGHANANPFSLVARVKLPPAAMELILIPYLLKKSNLVGTCTSE
jgi:hypothetical protein